MYKKISKQLTQAAIEILESIDYEVSDYYDIYNDARLAYNILDNAIRSMAKHVDKKSLQEEKDSEMPVESQLDSEEEESLVKEFDQSDSPHSSIDVLIVKTNKEDTYDEYEIYYNGILQDTFVPGIFGFTHEIGEIHGFNAENENETMDFIESHGYTEV